MVLSRPVNGHLSRPADAVGPHVRDPEFALAARDFAPW